MKSYLELMRHIITNGNNKSDRTNTGTRSLFGAQMRFNLEDGFPIVTTKKIHFKSVATELLWFLNGDTNVNWLNENGCRIWNEWADEDGNLGPVYGKQWRHWDTPFGRIDQVADIIQKIKNNPTSRRLIISAWNPADLPDESLSPQENVKHNKMALAPCHLMMQFYVVDGRLSCMFYARSQDFFLGTPFNISSYALLTLIVAQQTGLKPGELIWTGGDVHLYANHLEQAALQLTREPYPLPSLTIITKRRSVFDYRPDDFELDNYRHYPAIKAKIAV